MMQSENHPGASAEVPLVGPSPEDPAPSVETAVVVGAEPPSNATEPVVLVTEGPVDGEAFRAGVAAALAATDEASTLPPVPEGVVPEETASPLVPDSDPESGSSAPGESEPIAVRFLGSSIGPELDFVSPEAGPQSFDEVMVQLVDAALEDVEGASPGLTGEGVAQIFCRGDVEDPRVSFLLLLLAQNQPVTGELVLLAVRAREGGDDLVDGAVLAREELARAGDLAVEQLSAEGWQRGESRRQTADSSGSEPGAFSAAEVQP